MSFGRVLMDARKDSNLTLRDLAARILKEDGQPISAAYLNDIEHGRRNPPAHLIGQLAESLGVDSDVLYYWAGVLPEDVRRADASDARIRAAFRAFRKEIGK